MKIMRLFRPDGAYRNAFCSILTAGLLSACGSGIGELVAIVAIVTPLGGIWETENDPINERLQFLVPTDTEVFASKYDLEATLGTASSICGGGGANIPLKGTLDNGKLVLHPVGVTTTCLEGRFTDMVTLELMAGPDKLVYLNDRVDVNLDIGLWVSDGGGQLKLKFAELKFVTNSPDTTSVKACDVSVGKIPLSGDMQGFNKKDGAKPLILTLAPDPPNTQKPFTQVVFVDGATMTLVDSNDKAVTLHRTRDTAETCPPV